MTQAQVFEGAVTLDVSDGAGTSLNGGTVTVNVHSAGLANIYEDVALSRPKANPFILGWQNEVKFCAAPGDYDVVVSYKGTSYTRSITIEAPVDPGQDALVTQGQLAGYAAIVATGTAVLVAGTVTVANTSVTANSRIVVYVQTPGGTVGAPFVATITAGTSFVIKSTSATDTSTVRYEIRSY